MEARWAGVAPWELDSVDVAWTGRIRATREAWQHAEQIAHAQKKAEQKAR